MVKIKDPARFQRDRPSIGIHTGNFVEHHADVARAGQDGADRRGNVGRGECRCSHLVEQGLEQVMIATVDQGHVDTAVREPLGGCEAAKAGADNHNFGNGTRHRR